MKLMQIDDGIWTGRRANVEAINNLIRMHVCVCIFCRIGASPVGAGVG